MSPKSSDASKMQEELLNTFAESAIRVSKGWWDALKGVGLRSSSGAEPRSSGGRPDLSWTVKEAAPGASPARFKEMVEKATRDLPDLLRPGRDDKSVRRIKNKWLKDYEDFSREFFGIPAPSETDKALAEWKALLARASGAGYSPGLFPDFFTQAWAPGWFPGLQTMGAGAGPYSAWADAYGKTFRGMFPFAAKPGLFEGLDKSYRQALDAQIAFLNSLAGLHERIMKTASGAVDNVVDALARLDVKEVSDDTYGLFFRTWLAQNEKAFQDLFESDIFSKSLVETTQWGLEAKKKMESLLAEGSSVVGASNRTQVEELSRSVDLMTARVEQLEQEVRLLRRQVASLSGDEDKKGEECRTEGRKATSGSSPDGDSSPVE